MPIPLPDDPELRKEYVSKLATSALHDAHILCVYIDEQLADECGMATPTKLLMTEPYSKSGFNLQSFTSSAQYQPELLLQQNTKLSALTLNKEIYYGFWGSIYNSVMDNKPAITYDQLQQIIDHTSNNFNEVFQKTLGDDGKPGKMKRPSTTFVTTTLTDSEAQLLLKDTQIAELQGSVRKFQCGRACLKDLQNMVEEYRFPVNVNGEVDVIATRVGQDLDDPNYLYQPLVQGVIDRELLKMTKPKPKKPEEKKEVKKEKKEPVKLDQNGQPIKPKKKKMPPVIIPEHFPLPQEKIIYNIAKQELFNQVVSQTQPICKYCQQPLRFNIQQCRIPQAFKNFVMATSKLSQQELNQEQTSIIGQQHNNYQSKNTKQKSNISGKTIPNYHFVLLELGYNKNYSKVHEENIKTILAMKGSGILIRICKPSEEARIVNFPGIDAIKTNLQLSGDFDIENYCFIVEVNDIIQGLTDIMTLFDTRLSWITQIDDPKQKERFFPKKR